MTIYSPNYSINITKYKRKIIWKRQKGDAKNPIYWVCNGKKGAMAIGNTAGN